jgi:type I restriction-modification system DNA methylase subunit/restriction endonuclease S subunit
MSSSKQYTCELCKKVFQQKIDFTRHQNRKGACVSVGEIQQMVMKKEDKTDIRNELNNVFKRCLDILRDNEGLTGDKALRNMSSLLILKLLEPHFQAGGAIDISKYDFSEGLEEHFDDEGLIKHNKQRLQTCVIFSNLSKETEDNIPLLLKYIWDIILSRHPATNAIFLKGRGFDIRHQSTFKKIIDKLNAIDLSETEYDVLGRAYEEVIQDIMTGKVLGQFFTQPLVKKLMVRLIDPQVRPDGTFESCADPTMGTGGFLITYLQTIMEQAEKLNITLNWDYITTTGLYGKELEPDTYQLAVSNMLISSGHMFGGLDCGDSIRQPITRKFDNILANPPFGIKGLKYDEFQSPMKTQYVPIKTDNAVSLFIQAIIYMLNIGGKCAVVLPDGQDLFSKTNTTLVAVREYLMKTCDLKEIYYLPSGIFTNTSIKTCVFYFVKKREGSDVIEMKINVSKTQKETGRDYKFSKTHQTTKVAFYDYNPYEGEGVKHLLVEVPIERIVANSYSLNYAEYMKDDAEEEQYEDGVVVKTLGEVCDFQNGKRIVKEQVETGEYPVLGGGGFTSFYTNEYSREGKTCKISREGMSLHNCVMLLNEKYYLNSQAFTIKSKNESIMINEYLWYYLDNNKEQVFKCGRGTAQKAIDIDEFKSIKIPIPSLERQQEVVKYLDFIYEKANKTSREKIAELKQLNEFCLNNQKMVGENENKKLGELCEFIKTGKNKPTDNKRGTLYPYYGTGSISGYTDEYLYDGYYILTARNGTIGNCFLTEGKFFPSDHIFVIDIKDKCLMKYVYYILSNNEKLDKLKTGVGIPNITKGTLENLKIPVPSIERQQEIVAYCESNDALIRQLEMEIENNKKQAQLFIDGVVKLASSKNDQHHDDDQGHQNHDEHDDDHDAVEGEAPDTSANVVVSIASIEETTTTAISQNGPKIRKIIIKKSAANS